MLIFLCVFCCFAIFSLLAFIFGNIEYNLYIKNLAKNNTIEQIDKIIANDIEFIDKGNFKGYMLNDILDHKELWEQVRNYKIRNENTVS